MKFYPFGSPTDLAFPAWTALIWYAEVRKQHNRLHKTVNYCLEASVSWVNGWVGYPLKTYFKRKDRGGWVGGSRRKPIATVGPCQNYANIFINLCQQISKPSSKWCQQKCRRIAKMMPIQYQNESKTMSKRCQHDAKTFSKWCNNSPNLCQRVANTLLPRQWQNDAKTLPIKGCSLIYKTRKTFIKMINNWRGRYLFRTRSKNIQTYNIHIIHK